MIAVMFLAFVRAAFGAALFFCWRCGGGRIRLERADPADPWMGE